MFVLLADHTKGIPWLLCHAGFIKATVPMTKQMSY